MKLLLTLLCSLMSIILLSQTFSPFSYPLLGTSEYPTIETIDLDGDGDKDVIVTGQINNSRKILLYENNGAGFFTNIEETPFTHVESESFAFGDVDGDNDIDIIITGSSSGQLSTLYLNEGDLHFIEASVQAFENSPDGEIGIADIDNDGDMDVLITGSETNLYKNDGTGNFEAVFVNVPQIRSGTVDFFDADGDNDLDLFVTGDAALPQSTDIAILYKNDGLGNFEATANSFFGVFRSSTDIGDVDGDGDLDIVVVGLHFDYFLHLYLNDGKGNYSTELLSEEDLQRPKVQFDDIDNDQDLDIIFTVEGPGLDYNLSILENKGNNDFLQNNSSEFAKSQFGFGLLDLDMDGMRDIIIDADIFRFYKNKGSGNYEEFVGPDFEHIGNGGIAIADFTGDDEKDIILSGNRSHHSQNNEVAELYVKDGSGFTYTHAPSANIEALRGGNIDFADIDIDGDLDVLISGNGLSSNGSKIFFNDGSGTFAELPDTPFNFFDTEHGELEDLNGDGFQDVIIKRFSSLSIFLNNGSHQFNEQEPIIGNINSGKFAIADVDNDSDSDILIAGVTEFSTVTKEVKLFINDGNANFVESLVSDFQGVSAPIMQFFDADNDQDMDVFISGFEDSEGGIAQLYLNDGFGKFNAIENPEIKPLRSGSMDCADIDNDGDLDMVLMGRLGLNEEYEAAIYLNDGSGQFEEYIDHPILGMRLSTIKFHDFNDDGFQDLIVTGRYAQTDEKSIIYFNNAGNPNLFQIPRVFENLDFNIVPNPSSTNFVTLKMNCQQGREFVASIFDLNGRLLFKGRKHCQDGTIIFDLNGLSIPAGTYFIQLYNGRNIGTQKLIFKP